MATVKPEPEKYSEDGSWGEILGCAAVIVGLAILIALAWYGLGFGTLKLEDARYERCVRHFLTEDVDQDVNYATVTCHNKHYTQNKKD